MSKTETVLEMTLPTEPKSPVDIKDPSAPKNGTKPTTPAERIHDTATEYGNGFGNNMKEHLLPTAPAPAILDIDRHGLSPADGERLEMLSHTGEKNTDDLGDIEGIDMRLGNGSVHDAGADDGKWPWHDADETDYPYGGAHDDKRTVINEESPNVNTYQQKKNLAQGMMDLALLSANANQLRYVLESSSAGHPYYYSSITFISFSIILQIAVGIGLILNSRYDVNHHVDICKADKINNMTVLGVFLVTIVNVFITSFSVAPSNTAVQAAG